MHRSPHARLARWLRPAGVAACRRGACARRRASCGPAARRTAAAQQGQPAQGRRPAAQPPAPPARRPRAQPAAPVIPGQDAPADLPRRHQLRPRRRDRHRRQGQPVTDLKQDDFEVLEDNQPQAIEQFRLIKVDGNPKPGDPPPREIRNRDDEETEAARDDVRIFAILLDDYHVRRANSVSVREPLTRFIQTQLRPNDMIAVMYPLTPVIDVSFTRNHDAIISAINAVRGPQVRLPAAEPVRGELRALSHRDGRADPQRRRDGRAARPVGAARLAARGPQDRSSSSARASRRCCRRRCAARTRRSRRTRFRRAPPGGLQDSSARRRPRGSAQSDVNSRMRDVYQMANRNNTSIYSLDPRGLAVFEFDLDDVGRDAAVVRHRPPRAADDAGHAARRCPRKPTGAPSSTATRCSRACTQMVRDSSFYYLLGYSSKAPTDGKFHEIKVRVKRRGRRGARRAAASGRPRPTTCCGRPRPPRRSPSRCSDALATISSSMQAKSYVRTWVGTEKGAGGKTKVTLVWEPSPVPPGARRDPPGGARRAGRRRAKGDLVLSRPVRAAGCARAPDRPARATAPRPPAGPQRLTFEAPPGKLELRLTVEGADGAGTLDREDQTIEMPDLTAPQVALSTPRVFRARTARDMQALAADGSATPVIGREFSRTERLLIRFDVYAAGHRRAEGHGHAAEPRRRQDVGSAGDAGGGRRDARRRRGPQHDSGRRVSDSRSTPPAPAAAPAKSLAIRVGS